MASQKRWQNEESRQSILKKERHLAQLEQGTTEVVWRIKVAISPLGITTVEESLEVSYQHCTPWEALVEKRAYIEKG